MYGEGTSTRIGSFLSPRSPGRVPREREGKKRDNAGEGITGVESETRRRGGPCTCVRLRETGSGYGTGTDGATGRDGHGGVKAVENGERQERVRRRRGEGDDARVWTVATEPPRINPPLDERRCFYDLRSATIFAHSFCAIGVTGCLSRRDAKEE